MYQDFERAMDHLYRDALALADFCRHGPHQDEPELPDGIRDEVCAEARRLASALEALAELGNRMGSAPGDHAERRSAISTLREAAQG